MDKINNPVKVKTGSIKFDCPDCDQEVDLQEAFTEEKLGNGLERVLLVCPHCGGVEIGYYSNQRIRDRISQLRQLRTRASNNKFDKGILAEYLELQQKHIKYFDKFQARMKGGGV